MRETIRAALAADAALAATLTGGVYALRELTRQSAPGAFDANSEILPCALVRVEAEAQHGPFTSTVALSARSYVVVVFYQRDGFTAIDTAMARVSALLHRSKLGAGTWEITWADDSGDLEDEGLGCSMRYSRYVMTRLR